MKLQVNNIKYNKVNLINSIINFIQKQINIVAIVVISIILIANIIIMSYFPSSNELVSYKLNNLLIFIPFIILAYLIYFICKKSNLKTKTVLISVLIFQTVFSIIWINLSKTIPIFDQGNVLDIAKIFLDNTNDINSTGYIDYITKNPHQIGLVSYIQLIYSIFHTTNYIAVQYLNILWIALITFILYKITAIIYKNESLNKAVILICGFFIQFIFLSTFVYGDIIRISIFFNINIFLNFIYKTR